MESNDKIIGVVTKIYKPDKMRNVCTATVALLHGKEVVESPIERTFEATCFGLRDGFFVELNSDGNIKEMLLCSSTVGLLSTMQRFESYFESELKKSKEKGDEDRKNLLGEILRNVRVCVSMASSLSREKPSAILAEYYGGKCVTNGKTK